MLKLSERMGRDDLTVHGFRSTFRDWASERTNFPAKWSKWLWPMQSTARRRQPIDEVTYLKNVEV